MAFYVAIEIPILEFNMILYVGRGMERWFSAWWYIEHAGRYHYYLSAEPFQQIVERNYFHIWASVEGARGWLFVLRRRGLIIAGTQYRSRIAIVAMGCFEHIGETLGRRRR